MFRKDFKIKNNCQLKNSEKKKLLTNILQTFPSMLEDDLLDSFPPKECIHQMKISTYQGDQVAVFFCKGRPLIIEAHNKVIPSIYFLWSHPNIVHLFAITNYVLDKLINGADLMVPGIIRADGKPFGQVKIGDFVGMYLPDNRASTAVGVALMGSDDLLNSNGHGKAVSVVHTVGDGLFKLSTEKIPVPSIPSPPTLISNDVIKPNSLDSDLPEVLANRIQEVTEEVNNMAVESPPDTISFSMDDILMNAFLLSIKTYNDKISLPILTNLFYKNHMLRCIPPDLDFDLKRTKYKKLSNFLIEMEKEGIVTLQVSPKNVQSVQEINFKHPLLKNFKNFFQELKELESSEEENQVVIEVLEKYVVNSKVLPLFSKFKYKKGDYISGLEVRKIVTDYIKAENLQDSHYKGSLKLDPILTKVLTQTNLEVVDWKYLFDNITKSMGSYFEVKKNGSSISSGKGNIPLVDVNVKIRSGNKKVTLVDYLEIYGVDVLDISKECQHTLATSTTINKIPNRKGVQFQVQGNHSTYLKKLLNGKYGIPKKYINDYNGEDLTKNVKSASSNGSAVKHTNTTTTCTKTSIKNNP